MFIHSILFSKNIFRFFLPVLSVSLLICCNSNPQFATSPEEDKKAISQVSAARAKAFNDENAAGIAIHFTEDAFLMPPGKPALRGKEAVRSYYQSIFDIYTPFLESHYEEVVVSGDVGYGRGFAKVTLVPDAGGDTLYSTSKYINIMQKQKDGTWKTTHDIWNDNE